uniref:tRNA(Phe) (4-demethylwyosine(37)-C(7)) aminocarboxypropyltransferase n=1 Tax=Timema poppense TaxID=170557 RepID=A0A7R9CTJ7_TIMPO|nr:unnamed protein product [Timema poppensis]
MECLLAITSIRSCQTLRNQLKKLELYDENYKCTKLNSKQIGDTLWKAISSSLKVNRVALKNRIQTDGFRTPNVTLVWGLSPWVNYVDNEIKYGWDVERNMFSAGNAPERHRLGSLDCRKEVVVDLFAGIGYFTLPLLVHAKAEMVHACEWNPNAVTALSRKSWPIACAALKSSGGTLHIHENVSGLLHKSVVFCELQDRTRERFDCEGGGENICLECLSVIETLPVYSDDDSKVLTKEFFFDPSLVHKHCDSFTMVRDRLFARFSEEPITWKKLEWKVWALHVCHSVSAILQEVQAGQMSWKVSVLNIHHVKSYAPHVNHMVLDLHCSPVHL